MSLSFSNRRLCLLVLVFVFCSETQLITSNSSGRDYLHKSPSPLKQIHFNSGEKPVFQSLPHNFEYNGVSCILKDHKGYMWFGTADGLIKFDGINIYVYEHEQDDSTSIINSTVNDIIEDNHNNLWIGTSAGLSLYDRKKDNFIRVENYSESLNQLDGNYINVLCIDNNSLLWIGTIGNGLFVFDINKKRLEPILLSEDEHFTNNSNRITSLVSDKDDNIWIGTQNGLYIYTIKDYRFIHFLSNENNVNSLSNNNIITLTFDQEGILWIGTRGGGLNKLIKQNGKYIFKHYYSNTRVGSLSNNTILSLNADFDDYIWIGTENGGLNRLDKKTDRFEVFQVEEGNENSIRSNSIWTLYNDYQSRLWIGTANNGINVIDDKFNKFNSYKRNTFDKISLTDNDIKGFAEDSQGNVWIATDGGGLCKFNPKTGRITQTIINTVYNKRLVNNSIQAILCDSEDRLWVGTWAGGVDLLNKNGICIRNYKLENDQGGGDNNVLTLFSDSKGHIWAGTAGCGLFRYNVEINRFEQILCSNRAAILNSSLFVTSVLEDSDGNFWIGTLNRLINLKITKTGDFVCLDMPYSNKKGSISSNKINFIFEDSQGRLWFGTMDNGLNLFNRHDSTFTVFQKKHGLPSNTIQGILEDDGGYLWVTTNKGVSRFNPDSVNFINFTREDGLNSNEFYPRACLRTREGQLYLGGENGFNVFYPEDIKKNALVPPVYFTNFKIDNVKAEVGIKNSPLNKHISETSEITLSYKQSSFSIEYVALNYTRSARNQFAYILEGFDEDWKYVGNNRTATYTKIKPGKYFFKVKGSNNDGIWNNSPTCLLIKVTPPVWKTWWAMLSYVLLATTLILTALRFWSERIMIKNQLHLEQLGREKEHELNEANIQLFTNISHEFRTPLSLIIAPLESIILYAPQKIKEQLVVIYRNAQRLLHLTNDLMDFRKLEEGKTNLRVKKSDIISFITEVSSYFKVNAKRRDIHFSIETSNTSIEGYFDPDKLETIVLNLLSNAFKYVMDNGKIILKISLKNIDKVVQKYQNRVIPISPGIQYIEIEVTDNGPGISQDELPFIFDKYYQSRIQKNKNFSGSGIGLALVKGLIELHHGFINVKSIPNLETSFMFVLPIDREAYQEDELDGEQLSILHNTILEDDDDNLDNKRITRADFSDHDGEKPDLLIVEDNSELRVFLSNQLDKEFNIILAENGQVGIEKALEVIPDLIVSDILMPHCSGIELCKRIKTDMRTCHIPVILLTAKTTIPDQIEGTESGADAYLTKPFNMQLLLTEINQLIQSRKKLYAHFSQDVYIMTNKLTNNEMDQQFLQKAIDFIVLNIENNKLNVDGMAAGMNLSYINTYRKIKALTGKTVIEFIRIVRLKQAIKLMEAKKYSLAEIAYMTGFTSPAYFTKCFKDNYGKPPSVFLQK